MKKRIITLLIAGTILASITACGKKDADTNKSSKASVTETTSNTPESKEEKKSSYQSGEEILNKVFDSFPEDKKFPVDGGDIENPTLNKAGAWDISKKELIDQFLGLPSTLVEKTDAIASLTNQLNANFFTGSISHVKEGTDMDAFAKEFVEHLKDRQWVCGFPDTYLAIKVDNEYIITIFGQKDFTNLFKEKASSVLEGSEVLLEVNG